jgi:DNA-binding Lrp family transcriptional regulator
MLDPDKYIIYYDKKNQTILELFPQNIPAQIKDTIQQIWSQPICREILKVLSEHDQTTAPTIQEAIGHSMSTLHENIKRLEQAKLITTEMVYTQNKQKILKTNVLCVSKNTKLSQTITQFLNQGLWVDTQRSKVIVEFLSKNNEQWFTPEEISARTGIQVDEVQTLLDNWESQVTRSFSQFLRATPFEKQSLYRGKKK